MLGKDVVVKKGRLELGVASGVVKKSGAFYSYGDTRLGQGRENAKDFLSQHPEIAQSIESRVRGELPSLGEDGAQSAGDNWPLPEDSANSTLESGNES